MIRTTMSLFKYRHFILASIKNEFRARVAQSKIGALWFVLHPLAMALIFTLILSEVLGAKLGGVDKEGAYSVFLLAGLIAWTLFSEILMRCVNVFIEYGNTMKKIAFPRLSIPIIVLGGALINHLLLMAAVFFIIAFYGYYPDVSWAWVLLASVIICVFAISLGTILGVLNVFARDVGQVVAVVMQMWFWLTPIVYSADIVPDTIRPVMELNPMTPLVYVYQNAILYNSPIDLPSLYNPLILTGILALFAAFIFKRASAEMVDVL